MRQAPTISAADVIDRAADLIDDCGWSPDAPSDGVPYDTFRAIESAWTLLRDEEPDAKMPTGSAARHVRKGHLGVTSLFLWESDRTKDGVVAALREAAAALHAREGRR